MYISNGVKGFFDFGHSSSYKLSGRFLRGLGFGRDFLALIESIPWVAYFLLNI